MVDGSALPTCGCVALSAILAKLAPVPVILGVASHAVPRSASVTVGWMALNTIGSDMGAGEWKGGRSMVRGSLRPTARYVTLGTVLAALARVHIAVLMAGDAILDSTLELAVDVARPAFGLFVLPFEPMADPVRIKCNQDSLTPGVACGTLLAAKGSVV